jgi:hypothetical protein
MQGPSVHASFSHNLNLLKAMHAPKVLHYLAFSLAPSLCKCAASAAEGGEAPVYLMPRIADVAQEKECEYGKTVPGIHTRGLC